MTPQRQILIRTYPGPTQADASKAFQRDATSMSGAGFAPISQSWAAKKGGTSGFVVFGIILFVIGLFVLPLIIVAILFLIIGFTTSKGSGELTVTYQGPELAAPVSAPVAAPTHLSSLDQLVSMRERGLVTEEEFTAKRTELLGRL